MPRPPLRHASPHGFDALRTAPYRACLSSMDPFTAPLILATVSSCLVLVLAVGIFAAIWHRDRDTWKRRSHEGHGRSAQALNQRLRELWHG